MTIEKALWLQPFKTVLEQSRSDVMGEFRIRVIDFHLPYGTAPVFAASDLPRFGWLLWTSTANDPIVGAEVDPRVALARAEYIREAMVCEVRLSRVPECSVCSVVGAELEACSGCGSPVCEACTCPCSVVADRAVPLNEQLRDEAAGRAIEPPSHLVEDIQAIAEETNRLQKP